VVKEVHGPFFFNSEVGFANLGILGLWISLCCWQINASGGLLLLVVLLLLLLPLLLLLLVLLVAMLMYMCRQGKACYAVRMYFGVNVKGWCVLPLPMIVVICSSLNHSVDPNASYLCMSHYADSGAGGRLPGAHCCPH
jgi:hypothetical protein